MVIKALNMKIPYKFLIRGKFLDFSISLISTVRLQTKYNLLDLYFFTMGRETKHE
jgi:hypothetical protein